MNDKEGQSVEKHVIGYVITLYAAGTHILGIVDKRDSWITIKIHNFCGKCD